MLLAARNGLTVPGASSTIQLPPALLEKCFVPHVRNVPPSLNGHPIATHDPDSKEPAPDNALLLSPVLMDLAQRVLKAEIDKPKDKTRIRVTALCTPQLDSPLAVDAAVRYLAHHFKADVVILDAEDLADGEHGVLGVEFSRALWTLYSRHYELKAEEDALASAERAAQIANENLSRCKGALGDAKRAAMRHHQEDAIPTRVDYPAHEAAVANIDREEACATDDNPAYDVVSDRVVPPDAPASHPVQATLEDDDDHLNLRRLEQDLEAAEKSVGFALEALADLKAQHAVRARNRAVYYASALNWLRRFLRGGGSPFRRRFLYLRNFGATAAVCAPLIGPLLSALDDSSLTLPTIILAGVGRVRLLDWVDTASDADKAHAKTKHDEFLQAFDTNATLLAHVKATYAPEWRQTDAPDGRATSIADLFSRAILDRHAAGHWRLRRRGHYEPLRVDTDSVGDFEICSALAVALESGDNLGTEVEQDALARRVLAYHVPDLHDALCDAHNRQWFATPPEIVHQWMELLKAKSQDTKKALTTSTAALLSQVLHKPAQLTAIAGRLAAWLPPWETHPIKTSDVFSALEKSDAALAELQRSLSRARDGPGKKAVNLSAPSAAERVRNAKDLDEYETRLLGAIVDPATISTTYEDVCMQPRIIETLRSVVSLPLLYADAYSTGILGRESMAGVLLYGPPGTGKTMLCRALAKESGANMLQIQASSIRSTWHSEDEKLIHATFTLARRLGPCVIFIDEIDALFGSRAHGGAVHRATLTEFLQEMDGLKSASENKASKVVIVGATNRPQDLDDAVLRRLPRRVMVDLPGSAEREKIIKHYLAGETTDETVDVSALAVRTESYSGSDLKHLVFSAALAAFKDTIPDIWTRSTNPSGGKGLLPQRVLSAHHFDQALSEVSASASAQSESIAELRTWGGSLGS